MLLAAVEVVFHADDVVLAGVFAHLNFNDDERELAFVLQAVNFTHRDVGRFVRAHVENLVADGTGGGTAHHDPVLGTVQVLLQAEALARLDHDALHLVVVCRYEDRVRSPRAIDRLRHNLSVILSFVTVIVFFTILMVALVPQIVDSAVTFAGNLNSYVRSFQGLMRQLNRFALNHDIDLSQFITSSDELLQSITRTLPDNLNKIVNVSYGFGTKLFDWIISIILAVYLMMDGATLKVGFVRLMRVLLPDSVYENTVSVWSRCNKILVQYIAFDILDGMIIGTLNWIFMLIMKMPYVAVVSVIVGVTNLAPTFGPLVGALLGSFILVLANPVAALWFLLFTVILQTVDGYILKPRLFGESLGVSSVWILISLIIGGRLLGVPGILLAIPFAAIGDFLYHDYILNRLEEQKLAQDLLRANIEKDRCGNSRRDQPGCFRKSQCGEGRTAQIKKGRGSGSTSGFRYGRTA